MVGGAERVVSIENPEAMIPSPGETFHARDVFGPAAALLAAGDAGMQDLGPEITDDDLVPLLLPLTETDGASVSGEAWWVDNFGNVETNIAPEDLASVGLSPGDPITVRIGSTTHTLPWATSYGVVEPGEGLVHVDSVGLMALAVRDGRADEALNVAEGVSVSLAASRSATTG
jgi:S-adenosylmethionine hydrolase